MLKKFLAHIFVFICIFFLLITLFLTTAFSPDYYKANLDYGSISQKTGFSFSEIDSITYSMISYLKNEQNNLSLKIENNDIFKSKELSHMKDVKNVFAGLKKLQIASLSLILGLTIILYKLFYGQTTKLLQIFNNLFLKHQIILSLFLIIAYLFFDRSFLAMHELLFEEDSWLFTSEHLLIIFFPFNFFENFFTNLMIRFFVFSALLTLFISSFIKAAQTPRDKFI